MTSESEERRLARNGWKRCSCAIQASGTLFGRFGRKSTAQETWEGARVVVAKWESQGWDGPHTALELAPPTKPASESESRIRLNEAVQSYLEDHEQAGSSMGTLKKYRHMMNRLLSFAESKGYVMLDQFATNDIMEFRATWTQMSPRTKGKRLGYVKTFFDFCIEREWLCENPAALRIRRNRSNRGDGAAARLQKSPFTDAELQRMYKACERYGEEHPAKHRVWTGKDLADFITLSVHTGLRISDVALFRSDRLKKNGDVVVRALKNGAEINTWLPEHVQRMVRVRAAQYGPAIFGEHETTDLDVISDLWRRKLKKLWALCGKWAEPPTPHRFRHTFVRILLQRGVPIPTVADLIGDTEQMVRRHYAKWVPERQEYVRSVLRQAFAERSGSSDPARRTA